MIRTLAITALVVSMTAASATAAPQRKQAGSPSPLLARPLSQWPQIVLENEMVVAGETKRQIASFLVETSKGIVAVSAIPAQTRPRDRGIAGFQRRMSRWTMWSPEQPTQILTVASIVTEHAPAAQYGVAVALAPSEGKWPAHPLKRAAAKPARASRVFIVGCTWNSGCSQSLIEGEIVTDQTTSSPLHSYSIGLATRLDPARLAGAAVLDEEGNVFAVVTGMPAKALKPSAPTMLVADDLSTVLP